MKTEAFLVQANHHTHQVITCAITDRLLKNIPVSVVFLYRKSFDCNALVNSLKKVLTDFPFFAGTLKKINDNLHIDCNNQGVLFSVIKEDCTVNQILDKLPTIKKEKLVNIINPKKVISSQSPLMNINLTYFSCGGMALGICWHHSIGDMHTFMQLMKAWSSSANNQEYVLPLVIKERDKYLQENLEENGNSNSAVRCLNEKELLGLAFYVLFRARNKIRLRFYFSENELNNMKQKFSENSDKNLSRNDVLCAHLFSIILELDEYSKERLLSVAINYRSKMKLPENVSGNFVSSINISADRRVKASQLAESIRASVDNFGQLHMNFFSTKKYIEENGGISKIDRFIDKGIDPLKRTLLITSWVNFGTYDIIFGESKPFYFSSFGDYPFPWLSSITEGFSNDGLFYSALLPRKLARKLMQDENLKKIHRYRDREEVMPELVEKLEWLL
jgi:shikimate O-hydroxycinnamoyltransferase